VAQTRKDDPLRDRTSQPPEDELGRIRDYAGNGHFEFADDVFIEFVSDSIKDFGKSMLYHPGVLQHARDMRNKRPLAYAQLITRLRDARVWVPDFETAIDTVEVALQDLPSPQSGDELLAKTFPPLTYYCDRLLHKGLTILAGKIKRGKSYFSLDLALAIALGQPAFGRLQTTCAKVLFIALEDDESIIYERIKRIRPEVLQLKNFAVVYNFPRLGSGALEAFAHYMDLGFQVFFVDVLGRILPNAANKKRQPSDYQEFTDTLGPIQRLALDRDCAIGTLDHLRKAPAEEEVDEIAGSVAKAGVADTVLIYKRKGDDNDALLTIRGRRLGDNRMALTMVNGRLDYVGEGEMYDASLEQRKVLKALEEEGRPLHTRDLLQILGLPPTQYHRLRMQLYRLYNQDVIGRTKGKGLWTLGRREDTSRKDWDDGESVRF
jgi:hypothetical protein